MAVYLSFSPLPIVFTTESHFANYNLKLYRADKVVVDEDLINFAEEKFHGNWHRQKIIYYVIKRPIERLYLISFRHEDRKALVESATGLVNAVLQTYFCGSGIDRVEIKEKPKFSKEERRIEYTCSKFMDQ